ncbi:hypothetical protein R3P38DRAFT_3225544 [Favolaschia claudopus]|uniref:Uncharacterized protein n=1 Tax=Favolaschia claudopus TaxID=2862362 RepID=A0AAV9ZVC1_9AGAR
MAYSHSSAKPRSRRRPSFVYALRKPSYYDAKIAALSAKKYKHEGPGDLYVVACIPNLVLTNYEQRRITFSQLTVDTKLKLGHTKNLCRRRSQYSICKNQQTL